MKSENEGNLLLGLRDAEPVTSPADVLVNAFGRPRVKAVSRAEGRLGSRLRAEASITGDSLDAYMDEVGHISLLTPAEERILGRQIVESRDSLINELSASPAALLSLRAIVENARGKGATFSEVFHLPPAARARDDTAAKTPTKAPSPATHMRRMSAASARLDSRVRWWLSANRGVIDLDEHARIRYARLARLFVALSPSIQALEEIHRRCLASADDNPEDDRLVRATIETGGWLLERGLDALNCRASSRLDDYRRARDRLVSANLRLVFVIVRRYRGNGLSLHDLVQEGNLGLLRAAQKFDYRLGYKFSTYACLWVRQAVTKALTNHSRTVRIAAHMHHSFHRVSRTAALLSQQLGSEASAAQIAAELGLTTSQVRDILAAGRAPLSVDSHTEHEDERAPLDYIVQNTVPEPEDELEAVQATQRIAAMLDTLPARDALIMKMRYGIGYSEAHTLEQIGRAIGVSRERTRQLEARAMERLKSELNDTA